MIAYSRLVAALNDWRTRNGLPVAAEFLAAPLPRVGSLRNDNTEAPEANAGIDDAAAYAGEGVDGDASGAYAEDDYDAATVVAYQQAADDGMMNEEFAVSEAEIASEQEVDEVQLADDFDVVDEALAEPEEEEIDFSGLTDDDLP